MLILIIKINVNRHNYSSFNRCIHYYPHHTIIYSLSHFVMTASKSFEVSYDFSQVKGCIITYIFNHYIATKLTKII